jgi:hypothetical protein
MARAACVIVLLCALGCDRDGPAQVDLAVDDLGAAGDLPTPPDLSQVDYGPPIVAPPGTWTWIDVPSARCDDGSPTGIAVNPGDADKLVVFFNGGGACGDYVTCYQLNTAAHGPFGAAELAATPFPAGSIFDRTVAENPFATWSLVFIPYCTGDSHGGTKVVTYGSEVHAHVGHTNALVALDRLSATWPALGKLVVTGASAGGYGAFFNFASYRARWPAARAYLIDDSGPALLDADTNATLKSWFVGWGLLEWLAPICAACTTSTSPLYTALGGAYPDDRMALLSSTQDTTIRAFYLFSASQFEAALLRLATQVLDPLPRFHRFFVAGASHTMLGHPGDFSAQSVGLWSWLTQMTSDDPAWSTVGP